MLKLLPQTNLREPPGPLPYFNSLAEELLKAEGKGAIAAFSPSGLSLNQPAHLLHQALLAELVSAKHRRLGDAVLAAQAAYAGSGAFPELLSIYHLLGDPALTIRSDFSRPCPRSSSLASRGPAGV